MSSCCFIGIGLCSKYYLFILGICLFKFLKQSLFNFFQIYPASNSGMFGFLPVLYGHFVVSSIYTYIGYIIFSLLFYFISKKTSKNTNEIEEIKKRVNSNFSYLTQNMLNKQNANKITVRKIIKTVGACAVLVFQTDFSKIMYLYDISLFNIWTFYIVFILFFMKKFFVIEIFNHQKYSMYFVIIVCTILLMTSTFLPYNEFSEKNSYQKVNDLTGSYFACIPILIIFISFTAMTSFFIVYSKAIMDIEMFPPYILIAIMGITGLVLNLIVGNEGGTYYDNLSIYFSNMKARYDNEETRSHFFMEIFLVIPLYLIFSFLEFVCQIFSIYYLNPNFILIKEPIYYGTLRLVSLIYNIKHISAVMYLSQFFLLEFAEIFGLLGYIVYLEIIELKFCGLDTNIRRKIINRNEDEKDEAMKELNLIEHNDSLLSDSESSVEYNS